VYRSRRNIPDRRSNRIVGFVGEVRCLSPTYNETIRPIIESILPGADAPRFILSIFVFIVMVKFLLEFRKELFRGDNIEVIMAIVIAFLSITGLAPSLLVAPFTLALLTVLSASILKNRYILEKIEKNSRINKNTLIKEFNVEEVNSSIEHAKDIIFLGEDLSMTIYKQFSRIEDRLKNGTNIKILMIDPNSNLCDLAAMHYYADTKGEDIRNNINTSIQRCKKLETIGKETKGQLEIRLLDYLPPFGAIFVDPESDNGKLYLWYRPYKVKNQTKPKMVFSALEGYALDGYWYQLFKEEIIALWDHAHECRCEQRE
jgi:hypothetical protein